MEYQKNMSRALRRHHYARLKVVRKNYYGYGRSAYNDKASPRQLGMAVATAQNCSCPMCGNPRKWRGEQSLHEISAKQKKLYCAE